MWRLLRPLWSRKQLLVLLFSGLFCLLALEHCLWVFAGALAGSWGPRFECEELCYNCGEIPTHGRIEHDFLIRNTGRQDLHVFKIVPGCGSCTTFKLSNDEIASNETAILKLILDATKLQKGKFDKKVIVHTDDPARPRVIISMQGTAS